jgi:hypothetical protein
MRCHTIAVIVGTVISSIIWVLSFVSLFVVHNYTLNNLAIVIALVSVVGFGGLPTYWCIRQRREEMDIAYDNVDEYV